MAKAKLLSDLPLWHINLEMFFLSPQIKDLDVGLKAEFSVSNPQKCYGLGIFNLGKLLKRSE